MNITATAFVESAPEPTLWERLQTENIVKVSALGTTGTLRIRSDKLFFCPDKSAGGFFIEQYEISRVYRKYSPRKERAYV